MLYGHSLGGFMFGKNIILSGTHFVSSSLAKELQTYSQSLVIYMYVFYIQRVKIFGEPELVLDSVRILNYKLQYLQKIGKPQTCATEIEAESGM